MFYEARFLARYAAWRLERITRICTAHGHDIESALLRACELYGKRS